MLEYRVFDDLESISEENFSRLLSDVSEQRREKVLRFKFQAGRVQSLMAYVLLKQLLNEHLDITTNPVFVEGEHGKPAIEGSPFHFNMSHCKNAVACAVSDAPVGIDVERISRELKGDLCRYVLNEEEFEQVMGSDNPKVEFARLWTMKEALVKLSGVGITDSAQLRSLLDDKQNYKFHTEVNETKGWVMTIVSAVASNAPD